MPYHRQSSDTPSRTTTETQQTNTQQGFTQTTDSVPASTTITSQNVTLTGDINGTFQMPTPNTRIWLITSVNGDIGTVQPNTDILLEKQGQTVNNVIQSINGNTITLANMVNMDLSVGAELNFYINQEEIVGNNPPPNINTNEEQGEDTEVEEDDEINQNPIVEIGLFAEPNQWVFATNPNQIYVGPYHLHEDGTAMIGVGVLGVIHELIPDEIIIPNEVETQTDIVTIQVNLEATENDRLFFKNSPDQQYIGLYHKMSDDTLMIGGGTLGTSHSINPNQVIFEKFGYDNLKQVREVISDVFYQLWFKSNSLTDAEILSIQTTIRDGRKQLGRNEDEPLVFFKKDRNTLEARKDLQGSIFENICQYVFENNLRDYDDRFTLLEEELKDPVITDDGLVLPIKYKVRFDYGSNQFYEVVMATKVGNNFTDVLNLGQLLKPRTSFKIDKTKAREILDTNIFELLPTQTTRQTQIDNFFNQFDQLIGPTPNFSDVDGDGATEFLDEDGEQVDIDRRISSGDKPTSFITRLDKHVTDPRNGEKNIGKTLQSMRNRLNTYLNDVDNLIQEIPDTRPEYENKSKGFLKIRKENQAIILRSPDNDLLEFQKNNSYLNDGFTITMWVRFIGKSESGTLFNFGNPLKDNGMGFRLETRTNIDSSDNYKRWIRLVVREEDGTLRDNHWGITNRARRTVSEQNFYPTDGDGNLLGYSNQVIHQLYPNIPTDNLDEWFFICATYNPQVVEVASLANDNPLREDKQYWLNHKIYYNTQNSSSPFIQIGDRDDIVSNSLEGARCKVEIISKTDLLLARGFKVNDLSISTVDVDVEEVEEVVEETEQEQDILL